MSRLILIGTVHGDPRGYERGWKWLDRLRPDLVTVEVSPFSLWYRRRHGASWQRLLAESLLSLPPGAAAHPAIRRVAAQVAPPFEAVLARDWSRRHGAPWRPVDLGELSRRHLPAYARELLTPDNLWALLASEAPGGSLEEFAAKEYRRARLACQGPRRRLLPLSAGAWRRERLLARRLRRLAGRGRRLVHLGGWEHLAPWEDGGSLWHGVADLNPLRLLLDEADFLPA
jgi:hypothetical protein